ncbi:DUF771 domain-containing protein [Lysinibacillus sp. NPDC097287]|uniref:DUF771 domain-containing protein n=1 Tax=Lysinibacillus sp. NPDC097287 TaxID=3364144 RepID=UPI00383006F6
MQQKLNLNVTVQIPEGYVIVDKFELEELQKNQLDGVYWSMQDLQDHVNRKQDWIKENILYIPIFKQELDASLGGFVFYPYKKGQPCSFHAKRMMKFLDENFSAIHHPKQN